MATKRTLLFLCGLALCLSSAQAAFAGRSMLLSPAAESAALLDLTSWDIPRRLAQVQRAKPGSGFLLPLNGSIAQGYFTTQVSLGTPAQTSTVIVGTGGDLLHVACTPCTSCGKHTGNTFKPDASKTATTLGCDSNQCGAGSSAEVQCTADSMCGFRQSYAEGSTARGKLIKDSLTLPDATSSSSATAAGAASPTNPISRFQAVLLRGRNLLGWPAKDSNVTTGSSGSKGHKGKGTSSSSSGTDSIAGSIAGSEVVFGCSTSESGEVAKQWPDGVMGLGPRSMSLVSQLARGGKIADVFSFCLSSRGPGALVLGDPAIEPLGKAPMRYTPMQQPPAGSRSLYYTIKTLGFTLGTNSLFQLNETSADVNGVTKTVLDSGTTFSYLPTHSYNALRAAITQQLPSNVQPRTQKPAGPRPYLQGTWRPIAEATNSTPTDICWEFPGWKAVERVFPAGQLRFSGASITLWPRRYLFQDDVGDFCLGVFRQDGSQGTVLGAISMQNLLVQFDNEKGRVGFAETDCGSLKLANTPAVIERESAVAQLG